ncbi:MAG: hypothetical protein ACI9YL_000390 [Luteibaculaceae bacterium]|jgi:hypothetical protein
MSKYLLGLFSLVLLGSCDPEFSADEDGGARPIIYGVLEKNKAEQQIRITKSFGGGANAYESALNADSSRINGIDPVILVMDENEVEKSIPLILKTISNKEEGVFYGGEQDVYTFTEPLLANRTYVINFDYDGKTISAKSPVLNLNINRWTKPSKFKQSIDFIQGGNGTEIEPNFRSEPIVFTTEENTGQYEVYIDLPITKIYKDGSRVADTIHYKTGSIPVDKENVSKNADFNILSFVSAIGNFLDLDENITDREMNDSLTIELIAGGVELATYIEVNNPTTGIIQERPAYTNVSNGLGVFSTRSTLARSFYISHKSITAMALYSELRKYNFCSTRAETASTSGVKCP